MRVYLSNSDYLAHFDGFLNQLDMSDPSKLIIESHPKWINIHPAVLALTAALALKAGKKNVEIPNLIAPSGSYLDRMGLFNFTFQKSPYSIKKT